MGQYDQKRKSLFYYRTTPPIKTQGNAALCWAASLESWLEVTVTEFGTKEGTWSDETAKKHGYDGLPWKRKSLGFEDMKNLWGDFMNEKSALTPDGIRVAALDVGMVGDISEPVKLERNYLVSKLNFSCLYFLYFSNVMYHAIVVYGIDTGSEELLVMDPAPGNALMRRPLNFFKAPNRVNQQIFIGWAHRG